MLKSLSADDAHLNPSLFANHRIFSNILARIDLFKKVLDIQVDIVECGVFKGNGLMTFFQLSSVLGPYNFNRKVSGFDTFMGFSKANYEKDPEVDEGYLDEIDFNMLQEILVPHESEKLLNNLDEPVLVQ